MVSGHCTTLREYVLSMRTSFFDIACASPTKLTKFSSIHCFEKQSQSYTLLNICFTFYILPYPPAPKAWCDMELWTKGPYIQHVHGFHSWNNNFFTLYRKGFGTETGKWTSTIGSNESWFLSLSRTNMNISITTHCSHFPYLHQWNIFSSPCLPPVCLPPPQGIQN